MYTHLARAGKPDSGGLTERGPAGSLGSPGAPEPRMNGQTKALEYIPVADVEISSVRPERGGFTLQGRGADRADYRIDLELEVPVDQRTRSVLGELLSQSRWRVSRKAAQPLRGRARVQRAPGTPETT